MSHPRHLRVEADGGRAIVRLMDHRVMGSEVVEQLAAELLAVLNRPGIRRVVLDLADVRLLSSAALDRIVVLHHRADAAGVELQLTRLRPEVREVLEMTGLSRLLASDGPSEGSGAEPARRSGKEVADSPVPAPAPPARNRKKSGGPEAAADKRKKNRRQPGS